MTYDVYNRLADLMADMKITVVIMNYSIRESYNISKCPLSLGAYKKICQVLIFSNKPDHIFAHFLILEWSLIY